MGGLDEAYMLSLKDFENLIWKLMEADLISPGPSMVVVCNKQKSKFLENHCGLRTWLWKHNIHA